MDKPLSEVRPQVAFTERVFPANDILDGLKNYLAPSKDAPGTYAELRSMLEGYVQLAGDDEALLPADLYFDASHEQLVLNALRFRMYGQQTPRTPLPVAPRSEYPVVTLLPDALSA